MMPMFQGRYVERGSAEYESARTEALFNARHPSRYPAAVLEAVSEADVVRGRAVGQGARLEGGGSVRWSCLGGLERARRLAVDRSRRAARDDRRCRQPHGDGQPRGPRRAGARPVPARHGLVFPGGHCSTVGLGGYLLQGGQGWNSRHWGWGCENVLGVDVVTAAGELVHADAEQNADLFWAARGSGPAFFGVVTRFHLRVHPMPAAFTHTTYAFPIECFDELDHVGSRRPADARRQGRAGDRRHADPSTRHRRRWRTSADHAHDRDVRHARRGAPPDGTAGDLSGARSRPAEDLRRADLVRRREPDHGCAEPAGHALFGGLRVDGCLGRRTDADPRRDLSITADARVVRHLVRLGADPTAARHGLLDGGQRVHRCVHDLGARARRRTDAGLGDDTVPGSGGCQQGLVPRRCRPDPPVVEVHGRRQLRQAPTTARRVRPGSVCSSTSTSALDVRRTSSNHAETCSTGCRWVGAPVAAGGRPCLRLCRRDRR